MNRPVEPNDAQRPVFEAEPSAALVAWYRWGASIEPDNAAWATKLAELERKLEETE
jgi:hypothetical protein